jgi:hypothetical protein
MIYTLDLGRHLAIPTTHIPSQNMSLARAALRLPRVGPTLLESRIPRTSLAVVNQRRWLRKPPPRDRAWAERKDEDLD